jgi:signal peptidase I
MTTTPQHARRTEGRVSGLIEWGIIIALALACGMLLRTYVVEPYEVPSGSMLDTIQVGDRVLVEKVSLHFADPKTGDIVTFRDPEDASTTLIKRVIATGGQVVDIRDGVLYVDGVAQQESYVEGKQTLELSQHSSTLSESITYPYTVPAGKVWVMGDNRTNSLDSRYFGAVDVSSVTGRALCTYWPIADIRGL